MNLNDFYFPFSRRPPSPPPRPPATQNEASCVVSIQSSLNAELSLELLPVLSGAVEVVEGGIVSTLQGQNERDNAAAVAGFGNGNGGPVRDARFRLLFDPQVSGAEVGGPVSWLVD